MLLTGCTDFDQPGFSTKGLWSPVSFIFHRQGASQLEKDCQLEKIEQLSTKEPFTDWLKPDSIKIYLQTSTNTKIKSYNELAWTAQ